MRRRKLTINRTHSYGGLVEMMRLVRKPQMKLCKRCGAPIEPKPSKKQFCSDCVILNRRESRRLCDHKRRGQEATRNYIGYNQSDENNNNYINGLGMFRKYRKGFCERCGSTDNLCAHHRDRNRKNNVPENIETLCKSRHQKEHDVYLNLGKYSRGGYKRRDYFAKKV